MIFFEFENFQFLIVGKKKFSGRKLEVSKKTRDKIKIRD